MAHNLMGDRFIGTAPAWHGIMRGEALAKNDRMEHIIHERGMGVIIDKRPIGAMMDDGNFHIIPNRYSLFRRPTHDDPEYVSLGEVSQEYSFLQDDQFAQLVDMYLDRTGWSLESMGYLGDGETIWAGMKGGEFTVAKEDYRYYFHAIEHRDGKRNGMLIDTPVCIVCQNTMNMAEKNNRGKVSVRHTSDYALEMTWRMEMIADAVKRGKSVASVLKTLHKIALDEATFKNVVADLMPLPNAPKSLDMLGSNVLQLSDRAKKAEYAYTRQTETVKSAHTALVTHFEYVNDTRPSIAGTRLAGLQAITGWLDHDRGKKDTANQRRVRAEETIFGDGPTIRAKAYELLLAK